MIKKRVMLTLALVSLLKVTSNAFEVVNEDTHEVLLSKPDVVQDTEQEPDLEPHFEHEPEKHVPLVDDDEDDYIDDVLNNEQYKWHETLAEDENEVVEDLSEPFLEEEDDIEEDDENDEDPFESIFDQNGDQMNHYNKETKEEDGDVTDVIEEFDDELGNHVIKETKTGPGFQSVSFSVGGGSSSSSGSIMDDDAADAVDQMMQDMIASMLGMGPGPSDIMQQMTGGQPQPKKSQVTTMTRPPSQSTQGSSTTTNTDNSMEVYHGDDDDDDFGQDDSQEIIRQMREQQQRVEQSMLQSLFGSSAFFGQAPPPPRAQTEKNNFTKEQLSLKNDARFKNYEQKDDKDSNKEKDSQSFFNPSQFQQQMQMQTMIVVGGSVILVCLVVSYIFSTKSTKDDNGQGHNYQTVTRTVYSRKRMPNDENINNNNMDDDDEEEQAERRHNNTNKMFVETEPESVSLVDSSHKNMKKAQYDRKSM